MLWDWLAILSEKCHSRIIRVYVKKLYMHIHTYTHTCTNAHCTLSKNIKVLLSSLRVPQRTWHAQVMRWCNGWRCCPSTLGGTARAWRTFQHSNTICRIKWVKSISSFGGCCWGVFSIGLTIEGLWSILCALYFITLKKNSTSTECHHVLVKKQTNTQKIPLLWKLSYSRSQMAFQPFFDTGSSKCISTACKTSDCDVI